ncbi:TonB-dependent receptor [Sphingobium sp. SCG-1]|uniref:TonB-dependent receptor plug domain-containing protein n=1 Tax=Sphingobium sp. SCG-1 TaxID=2072936 RepID=UPI000CD67F3D|nr:TonB-dependent receptor [Sphingobium sp. SCG-1]AUW59356.1 TonB-dependent receptor [Sphingobium sp. SCG-1]
MFLPSRKTIHAGVSGAALALSMLWSGTALAQGGEAQAEPAEEIIVTGSRFGGRVATESLSPVDSLSADDLRSSGKTELQDMLKVAVPSFSTPRPTAAGVLDFLTPPTMRGLSTGQMLVLVNGKRRHTSASLNLGNQIGRGDVAYDFNAIPAGALGRVEVLRDGASAQYGSDAIAGVINLHLDDRVGYDGAVTYRQTTRGDGETAVAWVGAGFAIGDGGVIRVTAQYQKQAKTDRAAPDTRQQYFGTNAAGRPVAPSGNFGSGTGLTPSSGTLDPREASFDRDIWVFGQPKYENKQIFANLKLPVADETQFYAFGGYSKLEGTAYNFFRRSGQDENVRAIYPDGFLPLQDIGIENWSAAAGVKGMLGTFGYDLSSAFGNSQEFTGYSNSLNTSQGAASQTVFDRGSNRFRQWTNNLDLTKSFDLGDGAPLEVALGLEYRKEYFRIFAGEPASYADGGIPILDGPNAGRPAPVGAQPGGGTAPEDSAEASRNSKAVYGEIQKTFFDRLTIDGAVRYEDFSDFGDTWNWKVAGRLELVKGLALRGSYNTGFRAPALQQSNTSNTNISFVNGEPRKIRTISLQDPIASLVGATPLKPEKAENFTLGAVFSPPGTGFTFTADYFNIRIDDRIALSSNFSGTALTTLLAANGQPGIQSVAYLTNAVDTTTQGVDLTATWKLPLAGGTLNATLAGTFTETEFRRIAGTPAALQAMGISTVLFDLTQQVRFTDSIPRDKVTLNLNWKSGRVGLNLTNSYYGMVSQVALTGRSAAQVAALIPGYDVTVTPANPAGTSFDIIQHFKGQIITDLEASYDLTDNATIVLGADNILDVFPKKQIASTAASVAAGTNGADNAGIFPHAYIAPFGVNGATLYARLKVRF